MTKFRCSYYRKCTDTAQCYHRKKHNVVYGVCNLERRDCWYAGDHGGKVICMRVWDISDLKFKKKIIK